MELVIFLLIRSFREANFSLYCEALSELIPYFFANNNTNYARWLPVHLRDMFSLDKKPPELAPEFRRGNFVVHKTCRNFSALDLDQAHEHANAIIKADSGAIGLTENPSALRRWMGAGREVSHLVLLYETEVQTKEAQEQTVHHEQTPQAQKTFLERVKKLSNCLKDLGNPFEEESRDLYSIGTRDIANPSSAELLQTNLKKGQAKAQDFAQGLQENPTTSYDPIKRNRVDFFSQGTATVEPSKQNLVKDDW